MDRNELRHAGIKGMRWGIRRYQNKDGSLTELGKKRYMRDAREQGFDKQDTSTGKYYKTSKKNGRSDLEVDVNRYVREDLSRTKRLTDESSQMANKLKSFNDTQMKNRPKVKMDLSSKTDKELRDEINRAFLEKQYNDLFSPQTESKGREYASRVLETAGSVLAIGSSALGIAIAIKELKG